MLQWSVHCVTMERPLKRNGTLGYNVMERSVADTERSIAGKRGFPYCLVGDERVCISKNPARRVADGKILENDALLI